MSKVKMSKRRVAESIALILLFFIFSVAGIGGSTLGTSSVSGYSIFELGVSGVYPFGYALAFAITLAGGGVVYAALLLVIVSTVLCIPFTALPSESIIASSTAVSLIISHYAFHRLPKPAYNSLATVLSFTVLVAVTVLVGDTPAYALLSGGIMVVCGGLLSLAMPIVAGKKQLSINNNAGLGTAVIILYMGLAPLMVGQLPAYLLVRGLCVPLVARVLGGKYGLAVSVLGGLGVGIASADITLLPLVVMSGAASVAFGRGARVLSVIAGLLGYAGMALLFGVHYTSLGYALAGLGIGGLVYMLLPSKWLSWLARRLEFDRREAVLASAGYIVSDLVGKIRLNAQAYTEMGGYLTSVYQSGVEQSELNAMAGRLAVFCSSCERASGCILGLDMLGSREIVRQGRTALWQMTLSCGCGRSGAILRSGESDMGDSESELALAHYGSRLLMLGEMLREQARRGAELFSYDYDASGSLFEHLLECEFAVIDAYVSNSVRAGLVVLCGDECDEKLLRAIGECVGYAVELDSSGHSSAESGAVLVRWSERAIVRLAYAYAGSAKCGRSGDSYSATLHEKRAMFALCDARGSGDEANRFCATTLAVVEDFYRTGADISQVALHASGLMSVNDGENFSAIDILSVNRITGVVDIIKAGSPPTFILRADSVLRIDGSSLPLGAMSSLSPSVSVQKLGLGDAIVLVTDGVYDAFPNLGEYLAARHNYNPQKLADEVMGVGAGGSDDKSILVVKRVGIGA